MAILQVEHITKYFGDLELFQDLSFVINKGEKVALIAKNGTGKTSLIKIILGLDSAEQGTILFDSSTTIGYLEQDPTFDSDATVYKELYHSHAAIVEAKAMYAQALENHDDVMLQKHTDTMDALNAWDYEYRVELFLSKLHLDMLSQPIRTLSGGQKKRLALAKLLLQSPDFIILDEPTNHLDIDIIEWLEEFLTSLNATILMVTHDRYFLDRVCQTIIELDQKQAFKYDGNYAYFLEKKQERQMQLSSEVSKAQNLMRTELDWMRRQPKARGTKSKSRIDAFYDLQQKAQQKTSDSSLDISLKGKRLGNKVIELKNVSKSYGEKLLFCRFSHVFHRNEKVGIIGTNGCGKSSFLNIITEQILPDNGSLDYGETVHIGYYKQDGLLLADDKKLIDVIKEIAEVIEVEKGRTISAVQYLEHWLFPRSMHYMYVSRLSGGEKKRLYLMTILMKQPNFLILDEPTNDLDLYTLHVLEEYLQNFQGVVLIVSHDRFFTDKVVDHLFVFEGNGLIRDFPGNYSLYRESIDVQKAEQEADQKPQKLEEPIKQTNSKKGLSFKQKQELEKLEIDIAALESEKKAIEHDLQLGTLSSVDLISKSERIGIILTELDEKEMRWLELNE